MNASSQVTARESHFSAVVDLPNIGAEMEPGLRVMGNQVNKLGRVGSWVSVSDP